MYNFNSPVQAARNMPAGDLNPNPVNPIDAIRNNERRLLRKTSNGLGFYVLAYFLTMQLLAVAVSSVFMIFNLDLENPTLEYLLDAFLSVFAAFIPGLIYLGVSGYKIGSSFKKTYVPVTLLIPLIFIGMALAMVSNYAAELFDTNIGIFGLKNSISMTNDVPLDMLQSFLYIFAVSAVPAFAEEFAFRGIVMGRLRRYGDSFAIIASSVMFGAIHSNTTQIVFAFILGLVFAYIDCITDSIVPSIIIHFLNNFYAVIFDLLQSNTNINKNVLYILSVGVVVMFCLGGLLSFLYLVKRDKGLFKMSSKDKSPDEYADLISYKDKFKSFFLTPGVIIILCLVLIITILFLIPNGILS